jgi:outer membrane protein OmpA-like peptidoglycan-associated protein
MARLPIDDTLGTHWAVAIAQNIGAVVYRHLVLDLVNKHTGRAHRLVMEGLGAGVQPTWVKKIIPFSGSALITGYKDVTTLKAVNFDSFDGKGTHFRSESVLAYSSNHVVIYDGPAFVSPVLLKADYNGWGISVPGMGFFNGVIFVHYGDGEPVGTVALDAVNPDIREVEELTTKFQISQRDECLVMRVPGDVLFDFDKAELKPAGQIALAETVVVLKSFPLRLLYVNGYTDSVGAASYNMDLSLRRAKAVADWYVSHGYLPQSKVDTWAHGAADPVAPNRIGGRDNPAGRAENRRVELWLVKSS